MPLLLLGRGRGSFPGERRIPGGKKTAGRERRRTFSRVFRLKNKGGPRWMSRGKDDGVPQRVLRCFGKEGKKINGPGKS